MIVAVGSGLEGEMVIDPEVPQFDAGTLAQIAREDGEAVFATIRKAGEQFRHSGENAGFSDDGMGREPLFETRGVSAEKPIAMLGVVVETKMVEKDHRDTVIGRPAEFERRKFGIAMLREGFEKAVAQGQEPGTSRVHEGAVDVKKEELSRGLHESPADHFAASSPESPASSSPSSESEESSSSSS